MTLTLPAVALAALLSLLGAAGQPPSDGQPGPPVGAAVRGLDHPPRVDPTVAAIDALIASRRSAAGVEPAPPAPDLTVMRRLWLALLGTIPSLQEIRRFEADASPERFDRLVGRLLDDRRSADALARRLVSPLVGDDVGQFIVFRRDRFTAWLADQIHANRPWDVLAREMVSSRGLWTDTPAVNFITQAAVGGVIDAGTLAGRVSRVFLGARIDCAECHDHPFADWKQSEFEGLAACFAQARLSAVGVEDDRRRVHTVDSPPGAMTGGGRTVDAGVPYGEEWLGTGGTHREDLAAWLVHADNRRFDRAIANRMWSILFGRAWHEPVDDLPAPATTIDAGDVLDLLADDFRHHGRDLRRLLTLIASTEAFRLSSAHPLLDSAAGCDRVADAWAAFPLSRLPPDQIIGAMVATTSLQTIDRDSHLLTRTIRFLRENDFLREYGRVQDAQGRGLPATIPQALAQMNGRLSREIVAANAATATGRIAGMADDDPARLDAAFLVALTRRPTAAELETLLPMLRQAPTKGRGMEDLMWTLLNGPEFCWNH